jgi:nodulation protein E
MGFRRVVITGLGGICALGHNISEISSALRAGHPSITPIEAVDRSKLRFQNGCEVKGYDPGRHFSAGMVDLLDRFAQFGIIAAREAMLDAQVSISPEFASHVAIITGSSAAGECTHDAAARDLYHSDSNRVHPFTIPRIMSNASASQISLEFGITGPTYSISTACSSASHAIGLAFWMVRSGQVQMAVTGGSEAPFSLGMLKAWEAMRVIAPDTCRPFSRDRRGIILGEGGAMLILEPLEMAQARGVRVYGELVGFGMSSDAHHITAPSVEGPAQAIHMCLRDAGLEPRDIGYINAHGTGTVSNDSTETAAIHKVFGEIGSQIPVSSTKSLHGHALGAAGALEAIATVLAVHDGLLPPTANYNAPDPECNLNIVANRAQPANVEYALSNSFAFGGLNAVLAFGKYSGS